MYYSGGERAEKGVAIVVHKSVAIVHKSVAIVVHKSVVRSVVKKIIYNDRIIAIKLRQSR